MKTKYTKGPWTQFTSPAGDGKDETYRTIQGGEVRSKKTYAKFKELIKKATE